MNRTYRRAENPGSEHGHGKQAALGRHLFGAKFACAKMPTAKLPRLLSLNALLGAASILLCQSAPVGGQISSGYSSYIPHLTFDVVSIHESREGNSSYINNPRHSSLFMAERVHVGGLILDAYDIKTIDMLQNAPSWVWSTRYSITAKSDPSTDAELAKLSDRDASAEKRYMLQAVLTERFNLHIHSESKISTTYELILTERTPKLMPPTKGAMGDCNPHFSEKGIEMGSPKGCPLMALMSLVQSEFSAPVANRTGMTGMYAFHLMYKPRERVQQTSADEYPDIEHALKEQLGLELKQIKGPLTFWSVDQIERPTPN